jgi:hypothetical protein
MRAFVAPAFRPYGGYCFQCFRTPLVAVKTPVGWTFPGLCGRCYFSDPEAQNPDTWNLELESDVKG